MSDDFNPGSLLPAERFVLAKVREGNLARLCGTGPKVVRAPFLRHLLLGLPAPSGGKSWPVQLTGVRIQGAYIEGEIDLSDAATPGIGLPTLALEDCYIPKSLNFEAARISSLSVKDSRFRELILREAEIDGPLDFSGVKTFEPIDGLAWIDASGAIINGRLTGNGARLRAPKPGEDAKTEQGRRRTALRLVDADIRGSIVLRDGFVAEGGVSLDTAQVRGDILMGSATATAGDEDALSAQNARIGGMVALCDGFTAYGTVWLHGVSISGSLFLSRAKFRGAPPVSEPGAPLTALVAENADIGGPLYLNGTRAYGQIRLASARIRGDIEATGAQLRYPFRREPAVLAESIMVGDDLLLRGSVVAGTLDLTGARIGGRLALDGTQLFRPRGKDDAALLAINATIGENAEFKRPRGRVGAAFRATGRLDLTGVRIAGDLRFEGSRLTNRTEDGKGTALSVERARIEGSLAFAREFLAEGEVNLAGASVGRDLKSGGARFINPARSAIYAKDLAIGDDLQLIATAVEGDLRFERLCVSGSVKWYWLKIGAREERDAAPRLDLRHARIGSALKAERLSLAGRARIDLGGMRVATVQNWSPRGWGIAAQNGRPDCQINFDGFQYERIELASEQRTPCNHLLRADVGLPFIFGPPMHPRADPLLDWILHQPCVGEDPKVSFFPQPYRQLARVLRSQGEEEAAVTVAVAERWIAPQDSFFSLFRWLFGAFFGFGLLRGRATATLLTYIALGTLGVMLAQSRNMLVESMVVTASAYTDIEGRETRAFMQVPEGGKTIADIPCSDTAGGTATDIVYAIDTIVPFIPLHQETKCEIKPEPELWANGWILAQAFYAIIGWVVFSLWLGTFSGLLKRSEGEG